MKTTAAALVLFCTLCLWHTARGQGNCNAVSFGNSVAATIADLPVCTNDTLRTTPQCCSRQFILDRLDITRDEFRSGLREELGIPFVLFRTIAQTTRGFLDGNFLNGLFASFGGISFLSGGAAATSDFADEFRNNFDIAVVVNGESFDVNEFFQRFITRIKELAITQYASGLDESTKECIRGVIQENVNEANMIALARALETLRRVRTSVDKLATFTENLEANLAGFDPLEQCVERLVDIADCGSCLAQTKPVCFNWCGALARACYSPFHDALNDQFTRFWARVRGIFDELPGVWDDLNTNRRVFSLGVVTVANALRTCIDIPNPFGKRQVEPDTPRLPVLPGFSFDSIPRIGAFEYALTGPRFCSSFVQTARMNCRNGNMDRADDIDSFDVDGIIGQDANPAIEIDTSILETQASALGSPVDTFLDSEEFTSTAPGGGSLGLTATVSLLLVGLVIAMGMN